METYYLVRLVNYFKFEIDYCCIAFSIDIPGAFLVTFKGEEMTTKKFRSISAAKKGFRKFYKIAEAIWRDSPERVDKT